MSAPYRPRRRAVNKKGRNKHGQKFVMLTHLVLGSPAYKSLPALPRGVYTELRRRFIGVNNGHITCSLRELAKELHCSKNSAAVALRMLQDRGFIKCAQKGSFHFKVPHAPIWILTEEELGDASPTKEFLRWVPKEKVRSQKEDNASSAEDRAQLDCCENVSKCPRQSTDIEK